MKVAICSDLHLEFGTIELKNTEDADVLILSGDICVAFDFGMKSKYLDFFEQVCGEFNNVLYIMGNHEHYHGDFAKTKSILQDHLSHLKNLHILEKESFKLDDYVFVCGTLWTDMNASDSLTLHSTKSMMNDFRCVKNSNHMTYSKVPVYEEKDGKRVQVSMKMKEKVSTFSPEHSVQEHEQFLQYLTHILSENKEKKIVVVGHHAPSRLSIHPRYQNDTLMNGAYGSSLDFFIENHPEIVLWTHGHTHYKFDYVIGSTRVVCNPRGYIGYESRADYFELQFVEI